MTKALLLALCAASLAFSTGCLFSKKAKRPKESSAISAEVEENFRRRWVDRRAGELTAQGKTPADAQGQAEAEFRDRYSYTRAGLGPQEK